MPLPDPPATHTVQTEKTIMVRRRCDAAEMGRVALAEVPPVGIVGAG